MNSLEMVFYKDAAANGMTVWQYCLHFIMVCTIWGLGSFAVYKLSKGKNCCRVRNMPGSALASPGFLFFSSLWLPVFYSCRLMQRK